MALEVDALSLHNVQIVSSWTLW